MLHPPHLAAVAVFLGTVVLATGLIRLQLGLTRLEHLRWWAGNGRDVLNGFAVLSIATALVAVGFRWPAALLVAAHIVAAAALVEVFLTTRPRIPVPDLWAVLAAVAVSAPIAAWPSEVAALANALPRVFALP